MVSSSKMSSTSSYTNNPNNNTLHNISKLKAFILTLEAFGVFTTSITVGLLSHLLYFIFSRIKRLFTHPLSLLPYKPRYRWRSIASDSSADIGSQHNPYKVVCIGTGFSGIGLGIKLKHTLQIDNFILLERRSEVGGTWYDNQYPGCACDVPSNLYSFSFEPNAKWNYFFGRQPEIRAYLNHCTDKYDIRRHIRHNSTVVSTTYDESIKLWNIKCKDGFSVYTQVVVNAFGALSNPQYPKIEGIDSFKGKMMHSAVWDHSYDFNNKRVAVVGTGASSIQLVPELAKQVKQMIVFQRTPAWVVPRLDRKVTRFEKMLFTYFPPAQQLLRAIMYWTREGLILAFLYRWPHRKINEQLARYVVTEQIKDQELRNKLIPTWDLGCKRVLLSNDWYPTLAQNHVHVETDGISKLNDTSIITKNGTKHGVDCIVWSTGFQVQPQLQKIPIEIRGRNNRLLDDEWSDTVHAYKGITIHNYPNMFWMLGPNTGLGHNSIILMIESQINYITDGILQMEKNNVDTVEIKQNVEQQWIDNVHEKFKNSVWTSGGCKSWYLDKSGRNSTLYPGFTFSYRFETSRFDIENYNVTKSENNKTK